MEKQIKVEMDLDYMYDYDRPINLRTNKIHTMINEELDGFVLQAVQDVGIDVNKEALIQALKNDQERYKEAYRKGYEACKARYDEILKTLTDTIKET